MLTQNVSAGLAAYSFVSSAIGAYEAGANVFQAIGIGVVSGSASYLGARFGMDYMGGPVGAWLGANVLGGIGSEIGTAAIMGGDIGRAAVAGIAGGAASAFASPIVGGGVASVIHGGSFGAGALEGLYGTIGSGAVTVVSAMSKGQFQTATDIARKKGGSVGKIESDKTFVSNLHLVGAAQNFGDAVGTVFSAINEFIGIRAQINFMKQLMTLKRDLEVQVFEGYSVDIRLYGNKFTGEIIGWDYYLPNYQSLINPNTTVTGWMTIEGTKPRDPFFGWDENRYWEADL